MNTPRHRRAHACTCPHHTCTHACVHAHMDYTQAHTQTHVHKHAHVHMPLYTCVCVLTCTHAHDHMRVCACVCMCMNTHVHHNTGTHACIHACARAHTHRCRLKRAMSKRRLSCCSAKGLRGARPQGGRGEGGRVRRPPRGKHVWPTLAKARGRLRLRLPPRKDHAGRGARGPGRSARAAHSSGVFAERG